MNVQEQYEMGIISAAQGAEKLISMKEDLFTLSSQDYEYWYKIIKSIEKCLKELDKVIPTQETLRHISDIRFKLRILRSELQKLEPIDTAPWYKRVVRGIF